MIPKVIHTTWKTSEIPDKWKAADTACKQILSDYTHRLWTDDEMESFVKTEYPDFYPTYKAYKYHIQRCDVFRLLVLYKYGGIYMDLDVVCKQRLDNLLNYDLVLARSNNIKTVFANLFFMASPNNPFIGYCIQQLPKHVQSYSNSGKHFHVMYSTGPMFITKMVNEYNLKNIPNAYVMTNQEFAGDCNACNKNKCKGGIYFSHIEGNSWFEWDTKLYMFFLCGYKKMLFLLLILAALFVAYRNIDS